MKLLLKIVKISMYRIKLISHKITHQSTYWRTVLSLGSVQIACTRLAVGVVEVAVGTGVAVRRIELAAALTAARLLLAVASGVVQVAVTC